MNVKVVASNLMAGVLLCASAVTEDLVVGTLESKEIEVSSDTVQDGRVLVATRGTLNKAGDGKWTLPIANVPQRWSVPLGVRKGELVLASSSADTAEECVDVAAVLEKSALWLEADANLIITGESNVQAWLDVREKGDGTSSAPYQYLRAVSDLTWSNGQYPLATMAEGRTTVYFNEMYSGSWMDFKDVAGNSIRVDQIRHAFIVEATYRATGNFLGTYTISGKRTAALPTFPCGRQTVPSTGVWSHNNVENAIMRAARTYRNGEEIEPFLADGIPVGFCLFDVHFLGKPSYADCLMNDRNLNAGTEKQRIGGEHIAAIVLFTDELSEAERMLLECYFMNKYGLGEAPAFEVNTAKGTKVLIDEGQETQAINCLFSGEGVLAYGRDHAFSSRYGVPELCSWVDCEGMLSARWTPPMSISSGDKIISSSEYYSGLNVISRQSEAETGKVEKEGSGELLVRHVDSAVKQFEVKGGLVDFAAMLKAPSALARDIVAMQTGSLPNASAEVMASEAKKGYVSIFAMDTAATEGDLNAEHNGWHAHIPESHVGAAIFINTAVESSYITSWSWPNAAADGNGYITAKRDADIWTTFSVPKTARYAVSFWVASRANKALDRVIEVKVGESDAELRTVGTFVAPNSTSFAQLRMNLGEIEADDQMRIWFVCPHDGVDSAICYDRVEITEVLPTEIPNGDFELVGQGFSSSQINQSGVIGWDVLQAPVPGVNNIPSGFTTPEYKDGYYYNLPWSAGGRVQLYLSSAEAAVSTTCTPAAGVWNLVAKTSVIEYDGSSAGCARLSAEVVVGDGQEVISLGSFTVRDYKLEDRPWPLPFSVDGRTSVTIRIILEDADGSPGDPHVIVDDVKFVAAEDLSSLELIRDGSFESSSGDWTIFHDNPPDKTGYDTKIGRSATYEAAAWGGHSCFGDNLLLVRRQGGVRQQVKIGVPGFYRVRLYAQQRTRNWELPGEDYIEPISAGLVKDGTTNECIRFIAAVTNFTEYSSVFRVMQPGTYDFVLKGCSSEGDKCIFVDGVSLQRVVFADETPGLPEEMALKVSSGSKIRLDFPGTNKIGRVWLGGKIRAGIISAETDPDFISGPGTLEASRQGSGLILIVR